MKNLGILTLSADPITKGHLWLIKAALQTFDYVNVLIADNADKNYLIPSEDRISLTKKSIDEYFDDIVCDDLGQSRIKVIKAPEEQFAVTNLRQMEFHYDYDAVSFVRGIRNTTDMEYEKNILEINRLVYPDLNVTYLIPPTNLNHVSSSAVKGLYKLDSWNQIADQFVTTSVKQYLGDLQKPVVFKMANIEPEFEKVLMENIDQLYEN